MQMSKELSHQTILALIGNAIPQELQSNMIIIGSLAAAYSFFDEQSGEGIRTKDVDCMLSPGTKAIPVAKNVTQKLLDSAWTYRPSKDFPTPGTQEVPVKELPLVRLNPPGETEWFIELLCPPSVSDQGKAERNFERVETDQGHFALVSFGFFNLLEHEPINGPSNLRIANPSMMALCNLLHHPTIGQETIGGSAIKRSNKDLGRVLSLAYLTQEKDKDELESWAEGWAHVLTNKYPERAVALMQGVGSGLRELLRSTEDMEQAVESCQDGLLAKRRVTVPILQTTGRRILMTVIEPLERIAAQRQTLSPNTIRSAGAAPTKP